MLIKIAKALRKPVGTAALGLAFIYVIRVNYIDANLRMTAMERLVIEWPLMVLTLLLFVAALVLLVLLDPDNLGGDDKR